MIYKMKLSKHSFFINIHRTSKHEFIKFRWKALAKQLDLQLDITKSVVDGILELSNACCNSCVSMVKDAIFRVGQKVPKIDHVQPKISVAQIKRLQVLRRPLTHVDNNYNA